MYLYKQIDRHTNKVLGYVSYNEERPLNNNPDILLEEMTQEQYFNETQINFDSDEEEE